MDTNKNIALHFRYFLICVNYFFYGETVADYFGALVQREEPLQFLVRYHRFISFTLYLAGEFGRAVKKNNNNKKTVSSFRLQAA